MPTFAIITLGCKVNQYESESLACALKEAGWTAAVDSPADLVIVNTCTVTASAGRQSLQAVRQAVRRHPGARVVATGCDAQIEPERLAAVDGISLVVGQADKARIPELVSAMDRKDSLSPVTLVSALDCKGTHLPPPGHMVAGSRTRPSLKIQDGCDAFCTYCIVPYTRGPCRSLPADQVLAQIGELHRAGYHEVVLTGIHLGRYGRDLALRRSLSGLLAAIEETRAISRVRLSSIEPLEFDPALIGVLTASERVCHHFHIPLQSGDDRILKRMARPYNSARVRQLVSELTRAMPRAAIGMDVLVGFPGESQAAFENTYRLVAGLPLAYLHVFPFSPRSGTPAATMPDQVPAAVVKQRCAALRRLGREKRQAFYRRFVGQCFTAPVEGRRDPPSGQLKAVTDNYLPVLFSGPDRLMNSVVRLQIERLTSDGRIEGRCID